MKYPHNTCSKYWPLAKSVRKVRKENVSRQASNLHHLANRASALLLWATRATFSFYFWNRFLAILSRYAKFATKIYIYIYSYTYKYIQEITLDRIFILYHCLIVDYPRRYNVFSYLDNIWLWCRLFKVCLYFSIIFWDHTSLSSNRKLFHYVLMVSEISRDL